MIYSSFDYRDGEGLGILDPQFEHADKGVSTRDQGSWIDFGGSKFGVRESKFEVRSSRIDVRSSESGDRSSSFWI